MKITIGKQNETPKVPYFAKSKSTGGVYYILHLYENPPKYHAFDMNNCVFHLFNIDEIEPIKQPVTFENEWE